MQSCLSSTPSSEIHSSCHRNWIPIKLGRKTFPLGLTIKHSNSSRPYTQTNRKILYYQQVCKSKGFDANVWHLSIKVTLRTGIFEGTDSRGASSQLAGPKTVNFIVYFCDWIIYCEFSRVYFRDRQNQKDTMGYNFELVHLKHLFSSKQRYL